MNSPFSRLSAGTSRHGRSAFAPIAGRRILLAASAAALALTVGCATQPQVQPAVGTTKYTLENTDKFALLDEAVQHAITCTGLTERALANGHFEVVANLKNHETKSTDVQANCVFKDTQNQPTGDETAWQDVTIPQNSTVAVRFTAATATAKKYTVQVRQKL